MCGIIGYIGPKNAVEVIMEGLSRLEYRGYDSAGLALVLEGGFAVRRAEGKLSRLKDKLEAEPLCGNLGMGHTRWATHGRPSETNAHPHLAGDVAVVHNGIIENYLELKAELTAKGCVFSSETDTEIVAHLLQTMLAEGAPDLATAVYQALRRIRGSYALVILDRKQPDTIIGARKDSPLILGLGQEPGEFFLASDVPAFSAMAGDQEMMSGFRSWGAPATSVMRWPPAWITTTSPSLRKTTLLVWARKAGTSEARKNSPGSWPRPRIRGESLRAPMMVSGWLRSRMTRA